MSNSERMFPTEQRGLRIQGTGATYGGTVNTNILAFTSAAALWQSTKGAVPGTSTYPIGTTYVAPTEGSGNWINTLNDAAAGTGFKFNRRGVYQTDLYAEGDPTVAATTAVQLAISLDSAVGFDLVGAGTAATLSDSILGWQNSDAVAAAAIPLHVSVPVYITDTLAGGAQPSTNLTTTRGVGVMRMFVNNAANAAATAASLLITSIRATIVHQNDLVG